MSEGLFPNHPRSGDWETLKGRMLAPHIKEALTSTAHGDSRHVAEAKVHVGWESYLVNTGMTRGGGTMAK
jgi:hypothetical protein